MKHSMNDNNTDPNDEKALYDRWRTLCVDKLKDKLKLNIAKRKKNFEDVVTSGAHKILRDNILEITPNCPKFTISKTITKEAIDRMCTTIESWPGVHLSQCKKLPPIFKKYWRIADNWWNRQKGKWFGDLFFWPILHYNLHQYCKKILINKNDPIQFDYLFYIFLCDILHSKVSFKKARPNPLIFDLALEKSPKLQQWFTIAGDQHGVIWEITTKTTKKSIKDYAQSWVKAVQERKYSAYLQFERVNTKNTHSPEIGKLLNVFPNIKKRNSGSNKSNKSLSFSAGDNSDNDNIQSSQQQQQQYQQYQQQQQLQQQQQQQEVDIKPNPISSQQDYLRLMDECNMLKHALQQQQQQQQIMAQALTEMQMNQLYNEQMSNIHNFNPNNYYDIPPNSNPYQPQINDNQLIEAMQQIQAIQQQQSVYNHNNNGYNDNVQTVNVKQEQQPMIYSSNETRNTDYDEKQYKYYDDMNNNTNTSNHYHHESMNYDPVQLINQPEFLPQPPRFNGIPGSMVTPEPLTLKSNMSSHPLPPPLKTDAGKERRQSYHDVLNMKQYINMIQNENGNNNNNNINDQDMKPLNLKLDCDNSIHSMYTNQTNTTSHTTLTTASHTTVISNMPPNNQSHSMRQSTPTTMVSTPSGSDASGQHRKFFGHQYNSHRHNQYHYNPDHKVLYPQTYKNTNPVSALPSLQIYNTNYQQQQRHYYQNNSNNMNNTDNNNNDVYNDNMNNNNGGTENIGLPPPILPQQQPISPLPKQINNLLPPPNSSRRVSQISSSHQSHPSLSQSHHGTITPPLQSVNNNSFNNDQFDDNNNNNNDEIPFDEMEVSMMNNIFMSGPNFSGGSNFGFSNPNNFSDGGGFSGPNLSVSNSNNKIMNSITNMSMSGGINGNGMSISNSFVNNNSNNNDDQ